MQVETTKDQGLYNKPSATVHPGALAAGNLIKYNRYAPNLGPSATSGYFRASGEIVYFK